MAERTFFTLRYAVPGYVFILMSILVAYPKLQFFLWGIKDGTLIAAFLAFLYLLSGGAIGFLVSQPWYLLYNRFFVGKYGKLPEMYKFLREKYHLKNDLEKLVFFSNYLHRLSKREQWLKYTARRWDLLHICGSASVGTIAGSILGLSLRIDAIPMDPTLSMGSVWIPTYDPWVICLVIVLLLLFFGGARHAGRQEAMALYSSVREVFHSGKFPYSKARNVFSDDYFMTQCPRCKAFMPPDSFFCSKCGERL